MDDFKAKDVAEQNSTGAADSAKLFADSGFMEKESNALTGTKSARQEMLLKITTSLC